MGKVVKYETKKITNPNVITVTFENNEDKFEVVQSGKTILVMKNGQRAMRLFMNRPFGTEEELKDFIIPSLTGNNK